jgi:toxin ParE1/3/4
MKIIVSPPAEEELAAAAEWYESQEVGLGLELVIAVDKALDGLARDPRSCARWRDDRDYRMKVLDRFPFLVFYRVESDCIVVAAIAHARRAPGYWKKREP